MLELILIGDLGMGGGYAEKVIECAKNADFDQANKLMFNYMKNIGNM